MEKIILYTTHCPKCNVLKNKLDEKNISYEVCEDMDVMIEKGMMGAPNLEVDGKIYNFVDAVKLVGEM